MKEIKIRPRISQHDLDTKINDVFRCLKKDKVKVSLVFSGREFSHVEIGLPLMQKVIDATKEIARVESQVARDKQYFIVLVKSK